MLKKLIIIFYLIQDYYFFPLPKIKFNIDFFGIKDPDSIDSPSNSTPEILDYQIDLRNKKVIKFHKSLGAIETSRDNKQIYVDLNKKNYLKLKKKFSYFYN